MKNETELTFTQKLSNSIDKFFRNNKKLVIVLSAVLVVAIIAIVVIAINVEKKNDALFVALDNLETNYMALTDENAEAFLLNANELVEKGGNKYPGYKAKYLLADYNFDQGNYAEALALYEDVANVASKTYLAPLSLLNAAAAAENTGDTTKALALYNKIWDTYRTSTGESSKALFNTARIYETQGNTDLAKSVYQQLVDEFADSDYSKLAKNRLLVL